MGRFPTGTAILLEYAIAADAIATCVGAWVESLGLFGITEGWWVYLAAYVIVVGIQIAGVGEALKAMFVITAIALRAARDPRGDAVTAAAVLVLATGAEALSASRNPLVEALGGSTAGDVVNCIGLAGWSPASSRSPTPAPGRPSLRPAPGTALSYVLMMVSHIVLRRREPGMPRPYRPLAAPSPPGSRWSSWCWR